MPFVPSLPGAWGERGAPAPRPERPLRIAQVAPLIESVPPSLYGGTERVVGYLTEALLDLGHTVTLFASGDSRTRARLVACAPRAVRLNPGARDWLPHHIAMLATVAERAGEFDVIHFHIDLVHLPLLRYLPVPALTTLHGRLDLPDLETVVRAYPEAAFVSISDAQRAPLPGARWVGTVHHGLPLAGPEALPARTRHDGYLAFLGRISPEKRLDRAIEIARRAGLPLRVAAKIDDADRAYFEARIAPLLSAPHVEFVGEIGQGQKAEFLGGAQALLFPIDWPEPFGLVMIEAMACGTPVIAWPGGSVPEVVDPGITGVITDDLDEAARIARECADWDRRAVRRRFEERFGAPRMARDYEALYERLMAWERGRLGADLPAGAGRVPAPRGVPAGAGLHVPERLPGGEGPAPAAAAGEGVPPPAREPDPALARPFSP